jgi:hypothetical protein
MEFRFQKGQRVALRASGRTGLVTKKGSTLEGNLNFPFYWIEWDDDGSLTKVAVADLVSRPIPSPGTL